MINDPQARCHICRRSSYLVTQIHNHPRRSASTPPLFDARFHCPRSARWWVHPGSGEAVQIRAGACNRNTCTTCLRTKANLVLRALHAVSPSILLGLSHAGSTAKEVSARMTRLRRCLRSRIPDWQDAYFIEPHTRSNDLHVHAYATSEWSTDAVEAAATASMDDARRLHVRPVLDHGGLGYGMKMALNPDQQQRFLRANGGRVVHATRDMWRGPDGVPVEGGYERLGRWTR